MNQSNQSHKHKHKSFRDKLLLAAEILFIVIILISVYKIGSYMIDSWKSRTFSQKLQELVIIDDTEDTNKQSEGAYSETKANIPAGIDFEKLHSISSNAVAWIYCPDTRINYPVAHTDNNGYYLNHLLDDRLADAGTLFIDCRNKSDMSDWNTVIHGHNRIDGIMFASLLNYSKQDYYDKHPIIYMYTPEYRYKIEIIAAYTTDVNDLIYSIPATKENREKIIANACKNSSFTSNVTLEDEDKLVTLSTCSYDFDDARYVVVGKLVKED